ILQALSGRIKEAPLLAPAADRPLKGGKKELVPQPVEVLRNLKMVGMRRIDKRGKERDEVVTVLLQEGLGKPRRPTGLRLVKKNRHNLLSKLDRKSVV